MQTPQCGSTAEASCAPFFVVFARKVRPRALSDNERGNTNDKRRWTTTRRSRSRKFATRAFDCIEFEGRIQRSSIKMLQDVSIRLPVWKSTFYRLGFVSFETFAKWFFHRNIMLIFIWSIIDHFWFCVLAFSEVMCRKRFGSSSHVSEERNLSQKRTLILTSERELNAFRLFNYNGVTIRCVSKNWHD